jgi:uncharacterized protein YdeI (YjbR/CyaY-like superfamily)
MEITETIYVSDRKDWRKWLEKNYKTKKEIWLIFPNKASGKPRISYNAAVEEALCFGWIDSIVKKFAQKFSVRNPKTVIYSQPNIERLNKMSGKNKVKPEILQMVEPMLKKEFTFPKDITDEIKRNKTAWENYQHFPPVYKRIRIAFIEAARDRPDEFKKRLDNFIKKTEQNKMFGFGGIDEYF